MKRKPLRLARETLRRLDRAELAGVAGGLARSSDRCPTNLTCGGTCDPLNCNPTITLPK